MATQLKRMKIKEISAVDEPASPGAYIILAKRHPVSFLKYDDNEPRDDHGRWTMGGVGSKALGAAQKIGAALKAPVQDITNAAKKHLNSALSEVGAAGASAVSTRLRNVNPVRGGGVHFHFETNHRDHTLHTNIQVRPEHVQTGSAAQRALKLAHTILGAYRVGEVEPNPAGRVYGGTIQASAQTTSTPTGSRPGLVLSEYTRAPGAPLATPVRNPEPAGNFEALRPQQLYDHPDNGLPINVIPGQKTGSGAELPLNHPSIDYKTSGGHSYMTEEGGFVPAASAVAQKFMHDASVNTDISGKLPTASPMTSNGAAYRTESGDAVPQGGREFQGGIEGQYRFHGRGVAALQDRAATVGRKGSPVPSPNTRIITEKRLFEPAVQLFAPAPQLFGPKPQLFDKAFSASEARDAAGRWAAGGAAATGAKIKGLVSALKPTAKAVASEGAKIGVSFIAGAHGIPDAETTHLGTHVQNAVEYGVARIKADPKYQQFARAVGSKLLGTSRYLFRKSDGRVLSAAQHGELKGHIARVLSKMPVHPKVAASDAAMTAMCKGVHDHLCRELCA